MKTHSESANIQYNRLWRVLPGGKQSTGNPRFVMKLSLRTILALAIPFCICGTSSAKDIYESDIKEEQRVATFTISSANNDLEQASVVYSRGLNNLAWVYITDCGIKLDETKVRLKGHEERIAKALNFLGFGLSQTSRQKLMDSYFKIKDNISHAYVKMNAVEKDVGAKLGVDVTWVRQMLSALKAACEETKQAVFCDAYEKAKAAIASNNIVEVNRILMGVYQQLSAVGGGNVEVPPPAPAAQTPAAQPQPIPATPAASPFTSEQTSYIRQMMDALKRACDSGNDKACEYLSALNELYNNKDVNGVARLLQMILGDGEVYPALQPPPSSKPPFAIAGLSPAPSPATADPNSPVVIKVGDKDLVFNKGVNIESVYAGSSKRLKSETTRKITDMNANPPQFEVVSTRNWNLSIQSTPRQSSATAQAIEFNLTDLGGRMEFTLKNWTVTDASGSVIASGTEFPFLVTFTANGSYNIEVNGMTDIGSDFSIRSSIQIAL